MPPSLSRPLSPRSGSRSVLPIVVQVEKFQHRDAARIFGQALSNRSARTIVIDLARARDATTSAFAHLVLLRRTLLRSGRDLRVINLRDRAAKVYQVNRLAEVLPHS